MNGTIGTREELAWAAGLFDGEGYIGCVERKTPGGRPNPMISMVVVQWHRPDVIERFHVAVGARGYVNTRLRNGGAATEWTWATCASGTVREVVDLLWPWLSAPKREQAERTFDMFHRRREVLGVREWRRREAAHKCAN